MKKLFVFQDCNNDYVRELERAYSLTFQKNCAARVNINNLTSEYLINASINVVISNGLSHDWYLILKALKIVTITIDELGKYVNWSDIVIDYKNNDNVRYLTGSNYLLDGTSENLSAVSEVFELILPMEWDTNFFGFNIAFISCRFLSESVLTQCKKFIVENKIKLIYYLCNCHDQKSVQLAEQFGFHFVDIRLSFEKKLDGNLYKELDNNFTFGLADSSHLNSLKKISYSLYKDSRYYYDGNFPIDKIHEFYQNWLEKGVKGEFDNLCLCILHGNEPIGFCTLKYENKCVARIGLFGISENYQGKGIGIKLLNFVFNYLIDNNFQKITVVTQGRNYAAQRLYQKAGFLTKSTELWYHKWL